MHEPLILRRPGEMQSDARLARARAETIALVPTMGALHDGHLSLVAEARRRADRVVVSIFVNPTQFGPSEDFAAYPRDLGGDLEKLASQSVDVVFAPEPGDIYPPSYDTFIEVGALTKALEGAARPTHFRGVTTVVAKLFHLVEPHLAFFGEKDYQQLKVLEKMTRDLCFDVDVVGMPIVRENDGLAMSSRNAYLSPAERARATAISRALFRAEGLYRRGERRRELLLDEMRAILEREGEAKIDYVEARHAETLAPTGEELTEPTVLLVAVRIGRTRLIDNKVLR